MRRYCLVTLALLAAGIAVPLRAQLVVTPQGTLTVNQATPDMVVARLMTFDENRDGIVTRGELPERLQPLLDRDPGPSRDGLESAEIRHLAVNARPEASVRGLQIGTYGFGDGFNNFDTRLHIDGALDDLRLASDVRQKAGAIASEVQATSAERARAHLLSTMKEILTPQQLADFMAELNGRFVTVRAVRHGETLVFGATPQEAAGEPPVDVMLRVNGRNDLASIVAKYGLSGKDQERADAEIAQFNLNRSGRLSTIDSQAIADAMQGLLDDQQRDDLRAALERRPIVKRTAQVRPVTLGMLQELRVQPAR